MAVTGCPRLPVLPGLCVQTHEDLRRGADEQGADLRGPLWGAIGPAQYITNPVPFPPPRSHR